MAGDFSLAKVLWQGKDAGGSLTMRPRITPMIDYDALCDTGYDSDQNGGLAGFTKGPEKWWDLNTDRIYRDNDGALPKEEIGQGKLKPATKRKIRDMSLCPLEEYLSMRHATMVNGNPKDLHNLLLRLFPKPYEWHHRRVKKYLKKKVKLEGETLAAVTRILATWACDNEWRLYWWTHKNAPKLFDCEQGIVNTACTSPNDFFTNERYALTDGYCYSGLYLKRYGNEQKEKYVACVESNLQN